MLPGPVRNREAKLEISGCALLRFGNRASDVSRTISISSDTLAAFLAPPAPPRGFSPVRGRLSVGAHERRRRMLRDIPHLHVREGGSFSSTCTYVLMRDRRPISAHLCAAVYIASTYRLRPLGCYLYGIEKFGAPERSRTPNPQIRSLVLYPIELRARAEKRAGLQGRQQLLHQSLTSKADRRMPGQNGDRDRRQTWVRARYGYDSSIV
jgi:hypothetical protein